jgi:hypothetical protein
MINLEVKVYCHAQRSRCSSSLTLYIQQPKSGVHYFEISILRILDELLQNDLVQYDVICFDIRKLLSFLGQLFWC